MKEDPMVSHGVPMVVRLKIKPKKESAISEDEPAFFNSSEEDLTPGQTSDEDSSDSDNASAPTTASISTSVYTSPSVYTSASTSDSSAAIQNIHVIPQTSNLDPRIHVMRRLRGNCARRGAVTPYMTGEHNYARNRSLNVPQGEWESLLMMLLNGWKDDNTK